jgi:hypothetical protein
MSEDNKDKGKQIKEWLQMSVIVFTVSWTSYEFFFKEFIKPAHEPTALQLRVKLEYAGEKDGLIMLKSSIHADNPTNRRIYVPAMWYTVKGRRLSDSTGRVNEPEAVEDSPVEPAVIRHYAPVVESEILAEQRMLDGIDNNWWDPKDSTDDEISFAIPKGSFDFLDMTVAYLFAKNTDGLAGAEWSRTQDGGLWADFKFLNPPRTESELARWKHKSDPGYNWSSATLSLWEKP